MKFDTYQTDGFYDEMFEADGHPRPRAEVLVQPLDVALRRRAAAPPEGGRPGAVEHGHHVQRLRPRSRAPRRSGPSTSCRASSTATNGTDRARAEAAHHALNLFIDDVYNDRKIVNDGVVPDELICVGQVLFGPLCTGLKPPHGIWCHITGTDLVRDGDGQIYVLEDNLRCPSGVSYVLENREVMKRTFPQVFDGLSVLPVEDYPERLLRHAAAHRAADASSDPNVVVLTPGIYNSAYFEHSFLAQQMGVELVRRLATWSSPTATSTCGPRSGFERVDVIYRRIDDDFLDPADVPRRLDAGRAGADGRLSRRPRRAGQRARAPASPTTRRSTPTCRRSSSTTWTKTSILPNVPTFVCGDPNSSANTCWRTSTSWWSSRPTNRAATAS